MLLTVALICIGFVVLYTVWRVFISTWGRLSELGITHRNSSVTYFDKILYSGLFGLLISRIVWMVMNRAVYADVPWGILPYSRSATEFIWFTLFPWRFFRITEGIMLPLLWGLMCAGIVWLISIPTFRLVRTLKIEKRGVMRAFLLRIVAGTLLMIGYFAVLIYFAV
ncbi:MAG: hypothetical protein ACOYT9_04720 [Patescibacteria group bacterium]|jgi:hypothetical protein